LGRMGYRVIAAATPVEALRQAEAHPGEIDLLITDVVMPEMNGRDLAERIAAMSPGTRVLFMSGYTSDIIAKQGVIDGGARFLQKPFSLVDLGDAVQKALARTGMASGGEA